MTVNQIFSTEVQTAICSRCGITFAIAMIDVVTGCEVVWARMRTMEREKRFCPFCGQEIAYEKTEHDIWSEKGIL